MNTRTVTRLLAFALSHPRAFAGAILSLCLLALLPGCGGGGSNSNSSNGGGNNGGGTQTANYAEAVTLADGQTGALALTTSGNNATGTLAVAAATSNARARAASPHVTGTTIPPGIYPVTGTLAGGTFTLSGTISGTAFTLTFTPPSGSAAGSLSLVTGGATYTGTITTAPTGTSADTSIAGTYLLVSLTNPATSQMVTCPGSLAFGSSDSDTCGASEITTLNANGTYTITIGGTTASTGTYTLVGNILTTTGKELEASGNGQTVTAVSSETASGSTFTTTLLSSTASDQQAQTQAGEVFTYAKTSTSSTTGTAGANGGQFAGNWSGSFRGSLVGTPENPNVSGSFNVTVDSSGNIQGSGSDNSGNTYSLSGTVGSNGGATFGTGSNHNNITATFTGTFNANGTVSGTWTSSNDYTASGSDFMITGAGTFTGNKQ